MTEKIEVREDVGPKGDSGFSELVLTHCDPPVVLLYGTNAEVNEMADHIKRAIRSGISVWVQKRKLGICDGFHPQGFFCEICIQKTTDA